MRQLTWKSFLAALPAYPADKFSGKGIVIVAGGTYLESALIQVKLLREAGSTLRIQVWHLGKAEMTEDQRALFAPYNVETRDFEDFVGSELLKPIQANVGMRLFQLKPLAILHSDLQEIMLLDSDNVPLADPAYLFSSEEFLSAGSVFWPDYWMTAAENPIWKIMETTPGTTWEMESGQLLVNKAVAWKAINLCVHLNDEFYMKLLNGDKDTFRFSWLAAGVHFHMVQYWPIAVGVKKEDHTSNGGFCAHTMLQSDLSGSPLFVHHNQLKGAHLPSGENFKYMRPVPKAATARAVPVRGMTLANGATISCTDIQGTGITHVDGNAYDLQDSKLAGFEARYFAAKESIPKNMFTSNTPVPVAHKIALAPVFNADALMNKLHELDANTTCTVDQFELEAPTLVNDRLCEYITVCTVSVQAVVRGPSPTRDRVCANQVPETLRTFSVRVRPVKSEAHHYFGVGDTTASYEIRDTDSTADYVDAPALALTRLVTYRFQMENVPTEDPFIITLDNAGGPNSNSYSEGVSGNNAAGSSSLTVSSSSSTPSILYYQSSAHTHMGWRLAVKDASYTIAYQGNHAAYQGPLLRFNTAYSVDAHLFTVSDVAGAGKFVSVRETCKATCSLNGACKGLYIYRTSAEVICHGLHDVSGVATGTLVDSQSLLKIIL